MLSSLRCFCSVFYPNRKQARTEIGARDCCCDRPAHGMVVELRRSLELWAGKASECLEFMNVCGNLKDKNPESGGKGGL